MKLKYNINNIKYYIYNIKYKCRNLAVSRHPHTPENQIHFHDYPYGICGGQNLRGFLRVIRLVLISSTPPVLHTYFSVTETT